LGELVRQIYFIITMGKRPRTPHFIAGIGDGNVHDGQGNDNNSRLRGNKDGKNSNENPTDDDLNNIYNHRSSNHYNRNEFPHRTDERDASDSGDSWRDSLHDPAIPVMDLNLDLNDMNGGIGIDMNKPIDSGGPWQVSAFAFLGGIVVIAIILHFVAETSSGAGNRNKNKEIDKNSSSKHRHHSGSNSRPYQYRRRQRQRRMQKLRKKKTDEWSDDEEPIQNGARLLSMGNSLYSSFDTGVGKTLGSSFDDASPDHAYPYDYDYDYEDEYEYDNQNRSVYQQSNYYQEPNSYLSSQDISHRRTGATRDSNDYYGTTNKESAAGVVPTYKSPSASKYMMESSTSSANKNSGLYRPTATSPRAAAYSSGGSSPRQRRRKQQNTTRNSSSNDSYASPIWESDQSVNQRRNSSSSNNRAENNNSGIIAATTPRSSDRKTASRKHRVPSSPERYTVGSALSWQHEMDDTQNFPEDTASSLLRQPTLMTPTKENLSDAFNRPTELGAARLLDSGSRFSSFASIRDVEMEENQDSTNNAPEKDGPEAVVDPYGEIDRFDASSTRSISSHLSLSPSQNIASPSISMYGGSYCSSVQSQHLQEMHQKSLLLTPGNCEETPLIGNARKTIALNGPGETGLDAAALLPIAADSDVQGVPNIPYVPHLTIGTDTDSGLSPVVFSTDPPPPPPRSIIMDELRLVEMETGNSTHWNVEHSESSMYESHTSFANDYSGDELDESAAEFESSGHGSNSYEGSDISIPSDDPRKCIVHKRRNLTMSTDAATSLQSSIDFNELQLHEVIGGGGFGQVWKATWRGTPVAVKVLTGSAQNSHIAKPILEEFKAEINLLKGMRHPNICLYMGACLTPPNRAIITELAANGSAWDSLRLPLSPPYRAADGTPRGAWPLRLYLPGQHGMPPSSNGSALSSGITAPIPPRGTWPWELVKRVSCGAARGMAYLHSGNPPVLHRDLKSANLLLDESYTTKVCDFGLSRLKAQARSMTANCGTVQWMAPEVLANRSYDEKADVYSFGIIVWELLSRECPYEGMTPIQCALAVLNRDKRPEIPKWCPPGLHALIKACIKKDPSDRPTFTEIIMTLDTLG